MGPKKKCRQYSLDYLAFGFTESPNDKRLPMCLLCHQSFSNEAMKPSRLRDHLHSMHADKKDKPKEFFKALLEQYNRRNTIRNMIRRKNEAVEDGLCASYRIAELIAKNGKSITIGETLILTAIQEVISTVMHQNPEYVVRVIPLSNSSIQRRIDEMASDVEYQLLKKLRTTVLLCCWLMCDSSMMTGPFRKRCCLLGNW